MSGLQQFDDDPSSRSSMRDLFVISSLTFASFSLAASNKNSPYNDFFVICSCVLTFMATIALFMNTRTLFMSVGANVVHQIVVWSYHMNKISIRALPVVSFLSSFAFFSHGMITLVTLILETLEDLSYIDQDATIDGCTLEVNELILSFCAFLGSLFWMGSFLCMNSFVERGRNAKWRALVLAAIETEHSKKKETSEIIEDKDENELPPATPKTNNNTTTVKEDMIFIVESSSEDDEDDFLLAANETAYAKKKRRRRKKKEARRKSEGEQNV